MKEPIVATYRIVTPMFLGGAEPLLEAELRLSSFKGALRFWWRALRWAGVRSVEQLRDEEAELFGSTRTGQSRVRLYLQGALSEHNQIQERWKPNSWQTYTGYGLREKGERRYLRENREFKVYLDATRCSPAQIDQILSALKLLGLVGGLGARSRRGWGSITLTSITGEPWACPNSPSAWEQAVQALVPPGCSRRPAYTAFWAQACWKAGPPQGAAVAAQTWLASKYQSHVKQTSPKELRAQFGLPRLFQPRPRKERRASPLFLHIHQCPNGQCLPCALWLPAEFLPSEPNVPNHGQQGRSFVTELANRNGASAK